MTALTARYDEALALAAHLHREQRRKGTSIPYLSHLLAVSSLVLRSRFACPPLRPSPRPPIIAYPPPPD